MRKSFRDEDIRSEASELGRCFTYSGSQTKARVDEIQ